MVLLFYFLFFIVFGRLVGFAFKASWNILKAVFFLIFLPFTLVMLVVGGLLYVAFPILIVFGIISLLKKV